MRWAIEEVSRSEGPVMWASLWVIEPGISICLGAALSLLLPVHIISSYLETTH